MNIWTNKFKINNEEGRKRVWHESSEGWSKRMLLIRLNMGLQHCGWVCPTTKTIGRLVKIDCKMTGEYFKWIYRRKCSINTIGIVFFSTGLFPTKILVEWQNNIFKRNSLESTISLAAVYYYVCLKSLFIDFYRKMVGSKLNFYLIKIMRSFWDFFYKLVLLYYSYIESNTNSLKIKLGYFEIYCIRKTFASI